MNRPSADAGIAIGPILFVLALLGVIATMMASGGGGALGSAGVTDRIANDIVAQANLIRMKINECQMQYLINGDVNPAGPCNNDQYPCSDPSDGTTVSALTCPNDPLDGSNNERNIWTGIRPASLPAPTAGFASWTYINAGDDGGRCFWTAPATNAGPIVEGLKRAANKFTSQEIAYNDSDAGQKFVVFVTRPTGVVDPHCTVP